MTKIARFTLKQFGLNGVSTDFGKFGSLADGTPATTKDPATIQALAEYLVGWKDAVLATNRPALEDRNALDFLFCRSIAYLNQEGIPEYDSGTEYHQFSVVKKTGTYELYGSIINTNTGNALPSQVDDSNWQYLGSLTNLQSRTFMIGQHVELDYEPSAGDLTTNKLLFADGSAVSRTTYADLFAKVGVIHGQGDGATTFNLPDFRGRFPRGWDDGAGVDPNAGTRVADATGGVTGDNVGSVQDDEYEGHEHKTVKSGNSSTALSSSNSFSESYSVSSDEAYAGKGNTSPANVGRSSEEGGDETRPKNKYVWIGIAY